MNKVVYSKFSRDRQKKFQISTLIGEENGERVVLKTAVHEEGKAHLRQMLRYRDILSESYKNANICVCPCRETEEGIIFPYIDGESLEARIRRHVDENAYGELKEDFQFLADIIFSADHIHEFRSTSEFEEIFGTIHFESPKRAAEISNIDMIPSNLLMGEKCTLIDYEWVFSFGIPLEFVYARSLFLQEAVSSLNKEFQKELYAIGNVEMDEVGLYFQMEVKFQEYVAGQGEKFALSNLYQKMHCKAYPVERLDYRQGMFGLSVAVLDETGWKEIFYKNLVEKEVREEITLSEYEQYKKIRIMPVDSQCILKICGVYGVKNNERYELTFTNNSDFERLDNYYFLNPPVLEVENQKFESIYVEYFVHEITQTAEIIRCERQLVDENTFLKTKVEQLENLKVYKIYRKVRSIVKKGN